MPGQVQPDSLPTRLRAAVAASNRTAAEIARVCGFTRQNMQRYLDGQVQRSKHFRTIARELDVSVTWLMTGDSARAPSWWQNGATPSTPMQRAAAHVRTGSLPLAVEDMPSHWHLTTIPTGMLVAKMPKSQAIIDPHLPAAEGDLILLRTRAGTTLRRLGPTIAGEVVLIAVDGSGRVEAAPAPLAKAGVVVGFLFNGRR